MRRHDGQPAAARGLLLVTITVTLSCAALALILRIGLPAGIMTGGHRIKGR